MSERDSRYGRRDIYKHIYIWIERVIDEICQQKKLIVFSINNETREYEVEETVKIFLIAKSKRLFDFIFKTTLMEAKDVLIYAAAATSLIVKYNLQELSCSLNMYSKDFCNSLCSAKDIECAEFDILYKTNWNIIKLF